MQEDEEMIVIQDADNYGEVLGVLTIEGHTKEDFIKLFRGYKDKVECWDWEGVLEEMVEQDWTFCWDDGVCSIAI